MYYTRPTTAPAKAHANAAVESVSPPAFTARDKTRTKSTSSSFCGTPHKPVIYQFVEKTEIVSKQLKVYQKTPQGPHGGTHCVAIDTTPSALLGGYPRVAQETYGCRGSPCIEFQPGMERSDVCQDGWGNEWGTQLLQGRHKGVGRKQITRFRGRSCTSTW
jgi:hypothetical protein